MRPNVYLHYCNPNVELAQEFIAQVLSIVGVRHVNHPSPLKENEPLVGRPVEWDLGTLVFRLADVARLDTRGNE